MTLEREKPIAPPRGERRDVGEAVPFGIRLAGAWSWRVIATAVVGAGILYLFGRLAEVVIPVAVAVLLSGLLTPVKTFLLRRHVPRWVAVLVAFLGLLIAIAALITLVVLTVQSGVGNFQGRLLQQYRTFLTFLANSPLHISQSAVDNAIASAQTTLKANSGKIAATALTGADFVLHFLIGLLLTLFITLFFLIDGAGIWRWCVRLAPRRARPAIDGAGRAAWISIGRDVQVQVVVAVIDAVLIGVVAALLHVPFAVPLAVLVFLGAFIPIVGAVTTGALAVVVALVYNDPINALLMLIGVIAVNQLESHVLHPILLGGAVRLHPVAVVIAVALGSLLAGIIGAVFAVPIAAAGNSAIRYIAGGQWKERPQPPTEPAETQGDPSPRRDDDPRPGDVTTTA
ncbi:AI-2E family transporter [Amnibacterium sp. CER49]|uniref:AI-2E family transporter n=1 Tax=Amnibacterium sp. CER49 TaxID=3039161 RepID=UPI002447DE89|nr:AI-2E family transporter [Amnibacterium sp. CER49]MDH2443490.1 AI-2E family transporter [Amnibacterium sp. CER49]